MEFRMFSEHYTFDVLNDDDCKYKISNISPANLNRMHKHEHVETALDEYTYNWELVATNTERARGSDHLWLVDDEHYIQCSRSGQENVGNTIMFSKSTPEELRFKIVSQLFESVTNERFGTIQSEEMSNQNQLVFATPKSVVIHAQLNEEEQQQYYSDIADTTTELLEKYYQAKTIEDIEEIIDWYNSKTKDIYYDYIPTERTKIWELFTERDYNCPNGWLTPETVEEDASTIAILHEDYDAIEGTGYAVFIHHSLKTVSIEYEKDHEVEMTEEHTISSLDELEETLNDLLNQYP